MKTSILFMKTFASVLLLLAATGSLFANDLQLPAPHKTGGAPLMEALAKRSTSRAFDARDLSLQQLSDLLWAGYGINRPDGKRTAPSAHNRQELQLYALLHDGAYVYDPVKNILQSVATGDLRQLGAKTEAAVCLLYVADLSKEKDAGASRRDLAAVDSGFISQNVYLYAASEGLATGYRMGGFDADALRAKLKLLPDQVVVAVQPVGYPKP